jgi:Zn-dependent peptidase ImmA (M78 family)/transcriptional regulator with XRE-family HTH domain
VVTDVAPSERINPAVLRWARETAGLSIEAAAMALGLKDTAGATAVDKLVQLEAGDRAPSHTTLERAATVYKRPLIVLYMAEPPKRAERAADLRTQSGAISLRDNAILDALLRDIGARQQMLRDLLEDADEARRRPFVASARVSDAPRHVAAAIRARLNVTLDQQRGSKDSGTLFALLRAAAEGEGVYVLLLGDAGSWHYDIGEDVFRGFALVDDIAPIVVINDNDAVAARPFTLIHELAHIWIGTSGVSGPPRDLGENDIERFCNATASEFLLPADALPDLSHLRDAPVEDAIRAIERIAAEWHVSEPAVTYRLARDGWISSQVASSLFDHYAERWRIRKRQDKERRRHEERGGPGFYVVRRHRLGDGLLDVVRRALREDVVSHTRAARILGVGAALVSPLLEERHAVGR